VGESARSDAVLSRRSGRRIGSVFMEFDWSVTTA